MEHNTHLIFENPATGEILVLNAPDIGCVRAVADANQGGAIIEATGDFAPGSTRAVLRFDSVEGARMALEAGFSGPEDASELAIRRAEAAREAEEEKRRADEARRSAEIEKQANDRRSAKRGAAVDDGPAPETPEVVND